MHKYILVHKSKYGDNFTTLMYYNCRSDRCTPACITKKN